MATQPLRKRRRLHDRRPSLEHRYSDAYRCLFNAYVASAAARCDTEPAAAPGTTHVGAVAWSPREQADFFTALQRCGRDHVPAIARAVASKTPPETRAFLLLLQAAAASHSGPRLTLRDLPAAVDVGPDCDRRLEDAADALAWYQDRLDAAHEQQRHGAYWLITPPLADRIEAAFLGGHQSRAASTPHASEPEAARRGVAGACTPCRQRKIKCDRQHPCNACLRSGQECAYPANALQARRPSCMGPALNTAAPTQVHGPQDDDQDDDQDEADNPAESPVLQAVPEAQLLRPQTMLSLSKLFFMNRSADLPSPWPHWSEYVSDIAQEPSMYRTAFSDFHRLVVSVTRRLVQTAIMQATSRLRAQRLRSNHRSTDKALLPLLRKRDVYTAIDVLGMQRTGMQRWSGVPRRCNLKVVVSEKTRHKRREREVPWAEVERLMQSGNLLDDLSNVENDTSLSPETFKSRTSRSGTPLPNYSVTLSDSDEDFGSAELDDDAGTSSAEERQPHVSETVQPRDVAGRYASVPPAALENGPTARLHGLEEFDREASRQDEQALMELLSQMPSPTIEAAADQDTKKEEQQEAEDYDEKIVTNAIDWRSSVNFLASWESYDAPVPLARFLANKPSPSPMPIPHSRRSRQPESVSSDNSSASWTEKSGRPRRNSPRRTELQARGSNAYALLQGEFLDQSNEDALSSSSAEYHGIDMDIPAQSIEAGHGVGEDSSLEDNRMEWD